MSLFKKTFEKALAEIDIKINGTRPWDIIVHDERLYRRLILRGSMGLGEAYMDGWWDCKEMDAFFYRILKSNIQVERKAPGQDLFHFLSNLTNRQTVTKALVVGERHYDIGNDLYTLMLDKRMTYTCGYWKGAKNLDEAEENKMDLVCRKLNFKPGQKILDIGCGFGSFAKFAAEKYGVHVTGITISKEQLVLARKLCAGLPVEILFQDYRNIEGMYDHIVSIGMFEAVGHKNYKTFMKVVHEHLKDDGLFLLHTIGGNFSRIDIDPWFDKYIFPNGILPSINNIGSSIEDLFVMEDWHNFGADYDRTLTTWFANFEKAWPVLSKKYSERFFRMWKYYLLSLAGGFRARNTQLWQIVFSKKGVPGGYISVR